MSPSRLLIAQTIAAMRIELRKRGVKAPRYPHLKHMVRTVVTEVTHEREMLTLRRL